MLVVNFSRGSCENLPLLFYFYFMDKIKETLDRILEACEEGTNIARDPERARKLLFHVQNGIKRRKRLEKSNDSKGKAKEE